VLYRTSYAAIYSDQEVVVIRLLIHTIVKLK
jgi:hypothetical protein